MSKKKSQIIMAQVGTTQMTVSDVGNEDYPQIQIVNAVDSDSDKNKSKLIFIGTGWEILFVRSNCHSLQTVLIKNTRFDSLLCRALRRIKSLV